MHASNHQEKVYQLGGIEEDYSTEVTTSTGSPPTLPQVNAAWRLPGHHGISCKTTGLDLVQGRSACFGLPCLGNNHDSGE